VTVLQIYNEQRSRLGGEPAVIEVTTRVLERHGHNTRTLMKSSRDLESSVTKKFCAFWTGAFDVAAFVEIKRILTEERPNVVHVHSVYPMFSPSVLVACRRTGIPVVMTVHTHNLTCPTWFHLYEGNVCVECIGGHEQRCLVKNCRHSRLESAAYAMRSVIARRWNLFRDNVDVFMVPTPFTAQLLVRAGYAEDQIQVVSNPTAVTSSEGDRLLGEYIAFAGRVSPEKGLDVLLAAAAQMPEIPFRIAGDGPALPALKAKATPNVEFVGKLNFEPLLAFYRRARILAVPSVWFEPFGMVAADAMALGVPVVASRIGGLPYVVDDGVTGILVTPGDPGDLVRGLRQLWNDEASCTVMGNAGRIKALRQFSQETFYRNLMTAYESAIQRKSRMAELLPIIS
jgi:glycosyltransferase involved in cell wall biosynthesis